MIWVKRPVYIVEGFPKDPYYSYGKQLFYVDRENFAMYYKVIFDRAANIGKRSRSISARRGARMASTVMGSCRSPSPSTIRRTMPARTPRRAGNIFQFNSPRMQPDMFTVEGLLRLGK